MSVVIFGADGQDGHYLVRLCQREGLTPIAVSPSGSPVVGDVVDRDFVTELIRRERPRLVFHLAARSTTRHEAALENHAIIGTGTLNILEAVYAHSQQTRVFLAGSGLQFVNRGQPISEDDAFDAESPYAATRIYLTYLARYYRRLGVKAYVGFLFHHESPRRLPGHLSKTIADAAREAGEGKELKLEIGDLSVEKEWTFAGDMVEAMWTLVNQDTIFEANLGTGIAHSVAEWAEACFSVVSLPWRNYVTEKEGFRAEYPRLVCNPTRIHSLGWWPKVGLVALAEMMVKGSPESPESQARLPGDLIRKRK